MEDIQQALWAFLPNLLSGLVIIVIGGIVAKMVRNMVLHKVRKSRNATLQVFVTKLLYILVLTLLVVTALSAMGVPTASLVAVLGASSLAIGLAMKDFLANIAAGMMLIFLKPFKLGDFINVAGAVGSVEEINLFVTQLKNPGNEALFIPNRQVVAGTITNKTYHSKRRLDLSIGIAYEADIAKARAVIEATARANEKVLEPVEVLVQTLADSSVNLTVRVWLKKNDFNQVNFALLEAIKTALDAEGISIPYPHVQLVKA